MSLFRKSVTPKEFGDILFLAASDRLMQLKESFDFREDCDYFAADVWPMVFNFWVFDKKLKREIEQDKIQIVMMTAFQNLIDITTKGFPEDAYHEAYEYIKDASQYTEETMNSESVDDAFNNPIRTLIKKLLFEMYGDEVAGEIEIATVFAHYMDWTTTKKLTSKFKIK